MSVSVATSSQVERAPQTKERRAWVRYPSRRLDMLCHLFGIKPPQQHAARVQDVSTQGIGFIVDRSFSQGSVLALRFPGTALEGRQVLVRVKHIQALADGQTQVGCTFVVPLSEAQLSQFI